MRNINICQMYEFETAHNGFILVTMDCRLLLPASCYYPGLNYAGRAPQGRALFSRSAYSARPASLFLYNLIIIILFVCQLEIIAETK